LADLLPDDPDVDLVPAAAGGDADAFEALVRRYQSRIIGLARSYTGNAADAEDLAQEVFVRVYRSLGRFRGESSFRTWLYKVALNVARSHHARRGRQQPVWGDSGADDRRPFDPPADGPDMEVSLVRRDAIERALADLPDDLREAVTLRDVHGLDYREIADATGAPMGTVESRIFRARQRLRRSLARLLGDAA
jgi:RNA polymerase sigma-70 factor (ECF subfamily)